MSGTSDKDDADDMSVTSGTSDMNGTSRLGDTNGMDDASDATTATVVRTAERSTGGGRTVEGSGGDGRTAQRSTGNGRTAGSPAGEESGSRLLGIAGSLRRGSYNRTLIRSAAGLAPEGTAFEVYDGLRRIPPFDEDRETPPPPPVADLRRRIEAADGVLFATPEYNGSVPGVLKNAVDWASRPYGGGVLDGATAAVIGASPSEYGAAWAQQDLRDVLEACGTEVLDGELALSEANERVEDGRLADPEAAERLSEVVAELAGAAARV